MIATIQIQVDGVWKNAATFEAASTDEARKGIAGGGRLLYDVGYAAEYLGKGLYYALSGRYPVNFEYIVLTHWPSFLVDLLPGGAGRRHSEKKGIPAGPAGDWPLLLVASGHPPGHLRVAEAVKDVKLDSHPGFERSELLEREDTFIEYAYEHGAPVAGSSDVQGDAPKFLLVEDQNGRWHAEGAISDPRIKKHWLVKFPRGKLQSDRRILFNEKAYYCIAKALGLRTHEALLHEKNTLFISRFDRKSQNGVVSYYGQESLYSLAGIADFGKPMTMESLCTVIAQHSTHPELELTEFIMRDILNVALGNTDNHGRNTAMQYLPNGLIQLTPLYDFAPMILDDAGIARASRWQKYDNYGYPQWHKIAETMGDFDLNITDLKLKLIEIGEKLNRIKQIMETCQAEAEVIEIMSCRIKVVTEELLG
ncbi:hypothetical protein MNBD_GAMMA07-373 [hydrothermal vent metagenome]|uniref:HipA-like C-terminal domain-containing protein n=1 Tax=hydrothermal vent metagenome TaxID=652676 RepID=A0A3B0WQM0_9ZZZZ